MKTKEFKESISELGFKIMIEGCWMVLTTVNNTRILKINSVNQSVVFFRGNYNCELDRQLLTLVAAYTNTPSEEREEEKQYYLKKILIPLLRENDDKWYSKPLLPNYGPCARRDREQNFQYQTIFTESEIKKMDITGFYKEEVK